MDSNISSSTGGAPPGRGGAGAGGSASPSAGGGGLPEVLRTEFYFDFGAHPFAHAGLFEAGTPVHAALRRLPPYLAHWFATLRSACASSSSSSSSSPSTSCRLLARVTPRPRTVSEEGGGRDMADDDGDDGRWYLDGEQLRDSLEAGATPAEKVPEHAVLVYQLSATDNPASGKPMRPVVRPASITAGAAGGRLYVGPGCRLTGCHLDLTQGDIYIGAGTTVDPFASVCGPTVVGTNSVIRTGSRIRGNCIFGDRVVVGGETKSSILMNEASFPHQSYVGDSICGFRSHFGNGATSANLGIYEGMKDESHFSELVLVVPSGTEGGRVKHEKVKAGTAKLGIIMGDFSQVGCNSVSDPATFLGPSTVVYALTSIRKGFYGPNEVLKNKPLEAGVIERAPFLPNRL